MGASCQVVLPVSRLPTKQGAASSGEENRLKGNGRASFARFDERFAVWGEGDCFCFSHVVLLRIRGSQLTFIAKALLTLTLVNRRPLES